MYVDCENIETDLCQFQPPHRTRSVSAWLLDVTQTYANTLKSISFQHCSNFWPLSATMTSQHTPSSSSRSSFWHRRPPFEKKTNRLNLRDTPSPRNVPSALLTCQVQDFIINHILKGSVVSRFLIIISLLKNIFNFGIQDVLIRKPCEKNSTQDANNQHQGKRFLWFPTSFPSCLLCSHWFLHRCVWFLPCVLCIVSSVFCVLHCAVFCSLLCLFARMVVVFSHVCFVFSRTFPVCYHDLTCFLCCLSSVCSLFSLLCYEHSADGACARLLRCFTVSIVFCLLCSLCYLLCFLCFCLCSWWDPLLLFFSLLCETCEIWYLSCLLWVFPLCALSAPMCCLSSPGFLGVVPGCFCVLHRCLCFLSNFLCRPWVLCFLTWILCSAHGLIFVLPCIVRVIYGFLCVTSCLLSLLTCFLCPSLRSMFSVVDPWCASWRSLYYSLFSLVSSSFWSCLSVVFFVLSCVFPCVLFLYQSLNHCGLSYLFCVFSCVFEVLPCWLGCPPWFLSFSTLLSILFSSCSFMWVLFSYLDTQKRKTPLTSFKRGAERLINEIKWICWSNRSCILISVFQQIVICQSNLKTCIMNGSASHGHDFEGDAIAGHELIMIRFSPSSEVGHALSKICRSSPRGVCPKPGILLNDNRDRSNHLTPVCQNLLAFVFIVVRHIDAMVLENLLMKTVILSETMSCSSSARSTKCWSHLDFKSITSRRPKPLSSNSFSENTPLKVRATTSSASTASPASSAGPEIWPSTLQSHAGPLPPVVLPPIVFQLRLIQVRTSLLDGRGPKAATPPCSWVGIACIRRHIFEPLSFFDRHTNVHRALASRARQWTALPEQGPRHIRPSRGPSHSSCMVTLLPCSVGMDCGHAAIMRAFLRQCFGPHGSPT